MTELEMTDEQLLADELSGRICAAPECTTDISDKHHFARFCAEHAPPKVARKPKGTRGRPRRDSRPGSINVNIGTRPTKKDNLKEVQEKARGYATMIAAVLMMAGQAEDAEVIANGADTWAESVATLSQHEEWLAKLMAGGETSQRIIAWMQFGASTAAIAAPIMVRRGWLPDNFRQMASQFLTVDGVGVAA